MNPPTLQALSSVTLAYITFVSLAIVPLPTAVISSPIGLVTSLETLSGLLMPV